MYGQYNFCRCGDSRFDCCDVYAKGVGRNIYEDRFCSKIAYDLSSSCKSQRRQNDLISRADPKRLEPQM